MYNTIEWSVINSNINSYTFDWSLTGTSNASGLGAVAQGKVLPAASQTTLFHTSLGGVYTMTITYTLNGAEVEESIVGYDTCPILTPETPTPTEVTKTATQSTPEETETTPGTTPDPTLSVPVTGVTPSVLIPVTGAERTEARQMAGNLRGILFNLGLAFFGIGLVAQAISRRLQA